MIITMYERSYLIWDLQFQKFRVHDDETGIVKGTAESSLLSQQVERREIMPRVL